MDEIFIGIVKTSDMLPGTRVDLQSRETAQNWLDKDPTFLNRFNIFKLVPVEFNEIPVTSTRKVII